MIQVDLKLRGILKLEVDNTTVVCTLNLLPHNPEFTVEFTALNLFLAGFYAHTWVCTSQ